jgi:hypothetical protein
MKIRIFAAAIATIAALMSAAPASALIVFASLPDPTATPSSYILDNTPPPFVYASFTVDQTFSVLAYQFAAATSSVNAAEGFGVGLTTNPAELNNIGSAGALKTDTSRITLNDLGNGVTLVTFIPTFAPGVRLSPGTYYVSFADATRLGGQSPIQFFMPLYSGGNSTTILVNNDRSLTTTPGSLGFTILGDFGSAPEPSTWAMMITGFGLVGFGLRRRRSLASLAP